MSRRRALAFAFTAAVAGCQEPLVSDDAGAVDATAFDAGVARDAGAIVDGAQAVADAAGADGSGPRTGRDAGGADGSHARPHGDAGGADAAGPGPGEDGGATTDAGSAAPTDAGGGPAGISIELDYRFDATGFFDEPERRRALSAAAAVWSALLVDDFEDIPTGTTVRVQDPSDLGASGMNFAIDRDIDDVLVFVACDETGTHNAITRSSAAIGSVEDAALRERLSERWYGSDYEPWVSAVTFSCTGPWFFDTTPETADDIPSTSRDFITVALHELGHVLGFGNSDAFDALVADGAFTGATASRLHGGAVPLAGSAAHFEYGTTYGGSEVLMDPNKAYGVRVEPTDLDLAALSDVGYLLRSPL